MVTRENLVQASRSRWPMKHPPPSTLVSVPLVPYSGHMTTSTII
jgi:hypothetical protein